MSGIADNIAAVRAQIRDCARRAGRDAETIRLIAVTKTRTPDEINEAIRAGVTDIGENKVQEILDKFNAVSRVNWHMIGHLQRNKVKYIIDKVTLIHSVDSLRLAEEIDLRAARRGAAMDILVQVNAAGEASKFGVSVPETGALIRAIADRCEHIRIRGLMCIAPAAGDPETTGGYFKQVKTLFDEYGRLSHKRLNFQYLSMGMSHDFGVAISEGANMVRIGTALFGARRAEESGGIVR
jgi:pyridoxal phosphate enzyme (YggS family)